MTEQPIAPPLPPSKVLARRVREHRELHQLTQAQLAERLKDLGWTVDRSMLARVEGSERQVSVDEMFLLAAALDTTPALLLTPADESELMQPTPWRAVTSNRVRAWIADEVRMWEQDPDAYLLSSDRARRVSDGFHDSLDGLFEKMAALYGVESADEIDFDVELGERAQAAADVVDLQIELTIKLRDHATHVGPVDRPDVRDKLDLLEAHPLFTAAASEELYRSSPLDEVHRRQVDSKPEVITTAEEAAARVRALLDNALDVIGELASEVAKRLPPPKAARRAKPPQRNTETTPA